MMDSVSANHGNLSSALCKDEGASITWQQIWVLCGATQVRAHCPYQGSTGHSSVSALTSRLPSATATSASSSPHLSFTRQLPAQHPLTLCLWIFPLPPKPLIFSDIKTVLVWYWFDWWPCEIPASQWELSSTLPYPFCFLYKLKLSVSRLLGWYIARLLRSWRWGYVPP
jgi:hypothetical protein